MVFSDQQNMETRIKPLHNFDLPCLKWGNQKLLKCMKVTDDDVATIPDQNRSSSSSKKLKSIMIGEDNVIEATRQKLMSDFHKEVGKMKNDLFDQRFPATVPATVAEDRPWNLRTRRAACKAPPVAGDVNSGINGERDLCFPARFRQPEIGAGKKREVFCVALSRGDVEDDFMVMIGRRLPRKPKKRPRIVQKQLDTLFPGLWLTEITHDLYKVPNEVETGGSVEDD